MRGQLTGAVVAAGVMPPPLALGERFLGNDRIAQWSTLALTVKASEADRRFRQDAFTPLMALRRQTGTDHGIKASTRACHECRCCRSRTLCQLSAYQTS